MLRQAPQSSKVCRSCLTDVPHSHVFCFNCGAALRHERAASAAVKRSREQLDERWSYLQKSFAPPSSEVHVRMMAELMAYLRADGNPYPTPQAATPDDVVKMFIAKDAGTKGRTIVHTDTCEWWGVKKNAPCPCPKRMKAATLRSQKASLQAMFRDLGYRAPWLESAGTGNPCMSWQVDQYLSCIEREQCAAGVETQQAALVDMSVFDRLMRATLAAWRESEPSSVARMEAARDAWLYSLLWNSGMRAGDALRLQAAALRIFADVENPATGRVSNGIFIDVTLGKTVTHSDKARRVTIWDNGDQIGPSVLLRLYQRELAALGLEPRELAGPLFRRAFFTDEGHPALGVRCTWAELDRAHSRHLGRAGMADPELCRHISLHSFHGSRAAREKLQGVPPELTCADMLWSLSMYTYYTGGRQPLSTDGILLMVPDKAIEEPERREE